MTNCCTNLSNILKVLDFVLSKTVSLDRNYAAIYLLTKLGLAQPHHPFYYLSDRNVKRTKCFNIICLMNVYSNLKSPNRDFLTP